MTQFPLALAGVLIALMSVFALAWHNKQVAKAEQAVHAHYAVALAEISQKTAAAQAAFRAQEASWQTKFDEEARDGQRRVEAARRDTERARTERDRLRADLNGYRAAARAAAHSDAPGAAKQPPLPSMCSPTCSSGLTKLRGSWRQRLTSPTLPEPLVSERQAP